MVNDFVMWVTKRDGMSTYTNPLQGRVATTVKR